MQRFVKNKGWVGDKSFTNLINTSYSMKNDGQTIEADRDSGVLSNPLSFIHGGAIYWGIGDQFNRGNNGFGYYWSLRSANTVNSNYLGFYNTDLNPQGSANHGYGFAVRCGSNPMVWWSRSRFYMSKRLAITYLLRRQILRHSHYY